MNTRVLAGGCHCGALRYALHWPEQAAIPARRCGCSYCTRFEGTWTSHPSARLVLTCTVAPGRYRFGTKTADFIHCTRCGVVVIAVDDTGDAPRAVLNVNTLDERDALAFDLSDSDFDSETRDERLARRSARWIPSVEIREAD